MSREAIESDVLDRPVSSNVAQGRHPCCREQAVASHVAHWCNKLQTIFCRADSCKQCFTVQAVVSTGRAVAKIVSQGKQLQAMLLRAGNLEQCCTGLQLLRIMLQNAASYKQCCTGPGNVSNDSQGWQLQAMLPLAGSEQCKAIFHRACSCKQCFKGRQLEANLHGAGNCKQFCHRAGCWKQSFTVRAVASNVAWGWDLQFMLYRARSCKQCFTGPAIAPRQCCKEQPLQTIFHRADSCKQTWNDDLRLISPNFLRNTDLDTTSS